ncbi:MAG: hypothetical protein E6699_36030, partial [Bradyrhizobium sp.]|uniref:hypothetical protein n=1 Tax=Bradyrhizobium sp. TaxID=376 RepID=UPI0028FFBE58
IALSFRTVKPVYRCPDDRPAASFDQLCQLVRQGRLARCRSAIDGYSHRMTDLKTRDLTCQIQQLRHAI